MRVLLVLVSMLLVSCASKNIGPNYDFNNLSGKAVLFGSVTQKKAPGAGRAYGIIYYNGTKSGRIHTREEKFPGSKIYTRSDFEDVTGRIFVVEVPPGEYYFENWQVNNGTGARIHPAEHPKPLKHKLKAGQISYVGNVHFELGTGENIFGINITADAYPVINNNFGKDSAILKNKYRTLSNANMVNLVKETGFWGSEVINTHKTISPNPVN